MSARLKVERKPDQTEREHIYETFERAGKMTDIAGTPIDFRLGDWDITLFPGKIKGVFK